MSVSARRIAALCLAVAGGGGCEGSLVPLVGGFEPLVSTCGNGVRDAEEICDGVDLGGATCAALELGPGTLACASSCTRFVVDACGAEAVCGDGQRTAGEVCDGSDLAGQDCQSQGFSHGALACAGDCTTFDTVACVQIQCPEVDLDEATGLLVEAESTGETNDHGGTCGGERGPETSFGWRAFETGTYRILLEPSDYDGVLYARAGACAGAQSFCVSPDTPVELALEAGDTLVVFVDAAEAPGAPFTLRIDRHWCGDGERDGLEICDGDDRGGLTCADLGYLGGEVGCRSDCGELEVSDCILSDCGNGLAEPGEVCDGDALFGLSCEALGFASGALACSGACDAFDTAACVPFPWCGNGRREPGELCDGGDLGGATCAALGLGGGLLACDATCALDSSGCAPPGGCCTLHPGAPGCADAAVEACVCQNDAFCCQYEWDAQCVLEVEELACGVCTGCGDNVAVEPEVCDGADLRGLSCAVLGFAGGSLGCFAGCTELDVSACNGAVPTCGNGVAEGVEFCDGADTRGVSCELLGLPDGVLACAASCFGYDASGCVAPVCAPVDLGSALGALVSDSTAGGVDAESGSCVGASAPERVFRWTAPFDGTYGLDTVGSTLDTGLYVRAGSCDGSELACNDDAPGLGPQSRVSLPAQAGDVWVIVVDGATAQPGGFVLNVNVEQASASCCAEHTFAGCDDAAVETCVCARDDYCCDSAWDGICVEHVAQFGCGSCAPAPPCCAATPGVPGCSDGGVQACVCAQDAFCCETEWDARCVGHVGAFACGVCP